jgi:hypothetical protein
MPEVIWLHPLLHYYIMFILSDPLGSHYCVCSISLLQVTHFSFEDTSLPNAYFPILHVAWYAWSSHIGAVFEKYMTQI